VSDGIQVNYSRFNTEFARMAATSKRDLPTLGREAMKGAMARVIEITPPAYILTGLASGGNEVVIRGDAKKHGQALVKSDIMSIYGTTSQAFDEIKKKEPFMAKAFWRHIKDGEVDRASGIAQEVIGKGIYKFDDGQIHQNLKKGRARGRARQKLMFTSDTAELRQYIKDIQELVGWLSAGWNQAAATMGIKPPQWIWKHPAPGAVQIVEDELGIRITATNAVKFASAIRDLERRIQYALNAQADAMQRRTDDYLVRKFRAAGFRVSLAT
jgi:hypothetical protein